MHKMMDAAGNIHTALPGMKIILQDFLETEINGAISRDYFLGAAKKYKNDEEKGRLELTGNAYTVCIDGNEVVIDNIWDDSVSAIRISLDGYIGLIERAG